MDQPPADRLAAKNSPEAVGGSKYFSISGDFRDEMDIE
jgi:hypothetical protein